MIVSFGSKDTKSIWHGIQIKRLPRELQIIARRKLRILNNATQLADIAIPPGNRLEALKGDRKGQYGIRVNDRIRICFLWKDGDCHEVEITDYHS
jgi:proteic killer suppression protein